MAKRTGSKRPRAGIRAPDATQYNPGMRIYGPFDERRVDDRRIPPIRRRSVITNTYEGELDPEGQINPPVPAPPPRHMPVQYRYAPIQQPQQRFVWSPAFGSTPYGMAMQPMRSEPRPAPQGPGLVQTALRGISSPVQYQYGLNPYEGLYEDLLAFYS